MTRRHFTGDALSQKLAALPQPALPRDFAPVVLAQIARTPTARPRHSARSGRAWAPWAAHMWLALAVGLYVLGLVASLRPKGRASI
jgi:hypothetical protein